ncbi:MAG: DUF4384 domain-containing protein [Nitrospira sp.]
MNRQLRITAPPILIALLILPVLIGLPGISSMARAEGVETVRGNACYHFGDDETPAKARRGAMALAQEQAIRNHGVFVRSSSLIKNFQMEEDIVQTASAGMLRDITVEGEKRKPQEICITLSAKISPVSVEDLIKQRVGAKEIATTAQSVLFGLKVWTNKSDGRFYEGEKLIIYVQSERDAYLKLDYFQADGTVVHLVPNMYRGQAFIQANKTYSFGDADAGSPEQFVIGEPYGAEIVKGITGVVPFDQSADEDKPVGDSRNYLNRLRGIKVVAAASSVELTTESRSVKEYKRDSSRRRSLP